MKWFHVFSVDEAELEGVSHALIDVMEDRQKQIAQNKNPGPKK